jgi:hypothetical protein
MSLSLHPEGQKKKKPNRHSIHAYSLSTLKLRQKNHEFEVSLGYKKETLSQNKTNKQKQCLKKNGNRFYPRSYFQSYLLMDAILMIVWLQLGLARIRD